MRERPMLREIPRRGRMTPAVARRAKGCEYAARPQLDPAGEPFWARRYRKSARVDLAARAEARPRGKSGDYIYGRDTLAYHPVTRALPIVTIMLRRLTSPLVFATTLATTSLCLADARAAQESVVASSSQAPVPEASDEEPEKERVRYGSRKLTFIAPQLGYLFFPQAELEVRGFRAIVDPRNGLIAKVGLALGGNGLAFEITPTFSLQSGGINPDSEGFGNINLELGEGLNSANLFAVGGQFQLVFRIPIRRVVLSAGLGVHASYVFGQDVDFGTELYGRVPLQIDVFFTRRVGMFAQFGFLTGVTGIKMPLVFSGNAAFESMPHRAELESARSPDQVEAWYAEHQVELDAWVEANRDDLPPGYDAQRVAGDFVQDQISQSIRFGTGIGLEMSIGFRF